MPTRPPAIPAVLVLSLAACDPPAEADDATELRLAPVPQLPPGPNLCPNDNAVYDTAMPGNGFCSYDAGRYSEWNQITSITCEPYTGEDGIARHLTTCAWRSERRLEPETYLVDFKGQDGSNGCGGFAMPLTPCPVHTAVVADSYTVSDQGACPLAGGTIVNGFPIAQYNECGFDSFTSPLNPTPSKTREASLATCCSSPGGTCAGEYEPPLEHAKFQGEGFCNPTRYDCKPGFQATYPWGKPNCRCQCAPIPQPPPGPGECDSECSSDANDDAPWPDAG